MKQVKFTIFGLEGPTDGTGWWERQTFYSDDTVLIERFEQDQKTLIDSKTIELEYENGELDAD